MAPPRTPQVCVRSHSCQVKVDADDSLVGYAGKKLMELGRKKKCAHIVQEIRTRCLECLPVSLLV